MREKEIDYQTLRIIVDNAPDGICLVDSDGNIIMVNEEMVTMLGYSREEFARMKVDELVPEEHRPKHKNYRKRYMQQPTRRPMGRDRDLMAQCKEGHHIPAEISLSPIVVGSKHYVVAILRDSTYKYSLKRKIVENEQRALAANNAKTEFLANMSHETRTPLSSILGICDLLETTHLQVEQHLQVRIIRESANALLSILSSMSDIAKIESNQLNLDLDQCNIYEFVEELRNLVNSITIDKEVAILFKNDLPRHLVTYADTDRLREVILHLISNAIKFTERGNILFVATRDRDELCVSVQDSGIGIAPHDRYRLFQIFTQLDSSLSKRFSGTGIGLYLSKHLIEAMGGTLDFVSTVNVGSLFWFKIPLISDIDQLHETVKRTSDRQQSDDDSDDAATQEKQGNASLRMAKKLKRNGDEKNIPDQLNAKILLVDDNTVNLLVTKKMIASLGCQVHTATNGEEAIDKCKKEDFDLVLMDLQMPIMNGYDATQQIRKLNKSFPIVALTASIFPNDLERCLEVGMNDHISKPFTLQTIKKMIYKWI
jgi:PAS domain S-box-containing protein